MGRLRQNREVSSTSALVWFKRDLRLRDHAPLAAASRHAQSAALFLFERRWLDSPECDPQHLDFALASLAPLRQALLARGLPLLVQVGDAVEALDALWQRLRFTHLLSHEETGPGWSYLRDLAVAAWCRHRGVHWEEFPQTGVVRRLRDRRGWAGRWAQRMGQAEAPSAQASWRPAPGVQLDQLPSLASLGRGPNPRPLPPAGEHAAWDGLRDFLDGRGRGYRRALSSPLTAEQGCSRISAALAFGSLSMRCVHQATEAAIAGADPGLAHGLRGFASRLRWHCHFMQKLEDEPAIEWRNFAGVCDGLRQGDDSAAWRGQHPPSAAPPLAAWGEAEQARFEAWCDGRTGFPMVDACMRSLRATGWLNFRMRAMLVSFAAYQLWLHWRAPGLFLARQFLDFEPGIHWSQMQMQSGTTGINTLRIYSPAKQARDHDPQGAFMRRWLPEFGTPGYPAPIVDEAAALRHAKERLYGLRASPEARADADRVQARHGSRKAGLPPTARVRRPAAPDPAQGDLFGD